MTSTRSAPSGSVWAPIRRTALAKVVVMGVAGVFGLINTRLIISHFGTDAYAQYGLLATFPNLMPFTDLGIGAVILNAVAGSSDLPHDAVVRRTLTTALRVLLCSALVIATTGVVLGLLGLWPTLLGAKLILEELELYGKDVLDAWFDYFRTADPAHFTRMTRALEAE